jgi:hypothetical protein
VRLHILLYLFYNNNLNITMKRKSGSNPVTSTKRRRQERPVTELTNTKSVRELAEPYRLATAKFPIDALTPAWSIGSNRPIDPKHVQSLCRIFDEQHLQREAVENHLLVACSQAEVQRMLAHCQLEKGIAESIAWPSFHDWMFVNGSPAEIMAGQHRVEALRILLGRISKRSSAYAHAQEQGWWICDIYDIGRIGHLGQYLGLIQC